jgi:hypothetical protein
MSLALNQLRVDCFRGIRGCELNDLGRFNLLVGTNNSGKTSVLEALSIYANPLDVAEWVSLSRRREIKSSRVSLLDSLTWLFPNYGFDFAQEIAHLGTQHSASIQISSRGKYGVESLLATYDPRTRVEVPNDMEHDYAEDDVEFPFSIEQVRTKGCDVLVKVLLAPPDPSLLTQTETWSMSFQIWENEKIQWKKTYNEDSLPVQFISPFSHRIEQLQIKALTDSTLGGFKSEVVNVLQALDPQIKDIEILSKDGLSPSIYIQHLQTGMTPLSMFGDGIRKALTLALAIIPAANGVLLLDEMETSLHTSALQDLFKWLLAVAKQYNVQIFATTHSLEAVDAILKASEIKTDSDTESSDLVVYQLERESKSVKVKRLSDDLLYRLRFKRGLDIR